MASAPSKRIVDIVVPVCILLFVICLIKAISQQAVNTSRTSRGQQHRKKVRNQRKIEATRRQKSATRQSASIDRIRQPNSQPVLRSCRRHSESSSLVEHSVGPAHTFLCSLLETSYNIFSQTNIITSDYHPNFHQLFQQFSLPNVC